MLATPCYDVAAAMPPTPCRMPDMPSRRFHAPFFFVSLIAYFDARHAAPLADIMAFACLTIFLPCFDAFSLFTPFVAIFAALIFLDLP